MRSPDGRRAGPEAAGPAGPSTFEALLGRCARGDEAAFASLYDQVAPRLHGLVRRVVRDPAQSEEVTQEAFLEIWRTASRFDPGRGSGLGWMMTLAHRRAVDRVRAAEASTRRDRAYETAQVEPAYDSTEEIVSNRLMAQRVRDALGSLTETQRGAVELAYFGGYTHSEIARLLDLPLGTAKTRIRDGLIRLRDTMGLQS